MPNDSASNTIQRVYFYVVTFVSLLMIINGVILLTDFIFGGFGLGEISNPNPLQAATGLTFIIVGIPLWGFHWRHINHRVDTNVLDRNSPLRQFYFYLVLSIGIASIAKNLIDTSESLIRLEDFRISPLVSILLWLLVWIYHWTRLNGSISRHTPESKPGLFRNVYIYLTALLGLLLLLGGLANVIHISLDNLVNYLTDSRFMLEPDSRSSRDSYINALALMPSGLLLWMTHWILFSGKEKFTSIKSTYTHSVSIFGGILIFLGILLIVWIISSSFLAIFITITDQETTNIIGTFPAATTLILIGAPIFIYHVAHIRQCLDPDNLHATSNKIILYSLALFLIILLSIGLATFSYSCLSLLIADTQDILNGGESSYWQFPFTAGLSMILVGGIFWVVIWRETTKDRITGMNSQSTERKTYLVVLLCMGAISACATAIALLITSILALLEGQYNSETVDSLILPISVFISLILVVPFHFHVYRKEKGFIRGEPNSPLPLPKKVTVLSPGNVSEFVKQLEYHLGYSVQALKWADEGLETLEQNLSNAEGAADAIKLARGSHVILIPESAGIRFYSHDGEI
ncbi:DUF5671 domain-containing protein [Dehalococcoidia bacterium]|nr:DUF5671 domain-containing protein [Dehalococcoidia bacterium]